MQISRFMNEQPLAMIDAYTAAAAFLAAWPLPAVQRIVLVGSGSSLNANTLAAPAIRSGVEAEVEVVGPAEFLSGRAPRRPDSSLVVVTSQTGASTTSIEALRKATAEGAATLLITAAADGPAAQLGVPTLLMPIGEEAIGPKTKGYVATCATLVALAARLGAAVPPPGDLGNPLQAALSSAEERASAMVPDLDDLDHVLVAGDGAHFGTALEASLKIAEVAGVPTAAYTLEETLHGRLHGLTSHSMCIVLVADEKTRRQAERARQALSQVGVSVIAVEAGRGMGLPEPWCSIAAIFLFQYLAVGLCMRRRRHPDLMRYPGLTSMLDIKTVSSR